VVELNDLSGGFMSDFKMPEVGIGDLVLFYDNPFSPDSHSMGWISTKPGVATVKVLVFAEEAGFVEKPSVRHKDDPFWKTSETAQAWGRWGCWDYHPSTRAMKELQALLTKSKIEAAKKG
jgi:hypothetical protein